MMRQLKQVQLRELLYDLYGSPLGQHNVFGHSVETKAEEIVTAVETLIPMLQRIKADEDEEMTRWPGIWLVIEREPFTDLRHRYPEDDEKDLREYLKSEFPHRMAWIKATFWQDRNRLICYLYPVGAQFAVCLSERTIGIPASRHGAEGLACIRELVEGIVAMVSERLGVFLNNPDAYNARTERELPIWERFGTLRRKDFWAVTPNLYHRLKDELETEEIDMFCRIAAALRQSAPLSNLTLNDFLGFCEVCYAGAGYRLDGLDRYEKYQRMADGRDDGLLDLDPDSPEALATWLQKGMRAGHPWEIVRGGNWTHISLFLHPEADGYHLTLEGLATTRAAETIRMALALHRARIPFTLRDAERHRLRAQGLDHIGIVPTAFVGQRHVETLFPTGIEVNDRCDHSILDEHPGLAEKVNWLAPERLERI